MKLPVRTKQKKSEAESLAILQYKLGDLGIFRGQTENDYGIDMEIELVDGDQVTGRLLRIQVKSAKSLRLRKDGAPSIGGIKQSTLLYWCELSFRTNVGAYAVDLASQKIYVTIDLFWQASAKIDGGASSKSIEFLPEGPDNTVLAACATIMQALQPTIAEIVAAHTTALRGLKRFLMLLADAFHYDGHCELHEPDDFRDLLRVCDVLLWIEGDDLWNDPKDQKGWRRYDYWKWKSEKDGWDGISYLAAQPVLSVLIPALLRTLRLYRKRVLDSKFFWSHRDPQYLEIVYETTIPDHTEVPDVKDVKDVLALMDWACKYDQRIQVTGSGAIFVERARIPIPTGGKTSKKI